jgi:sodium transport system permease protein
MNWPNIATIYTKELRDMLRDRRTLLSMIIIPTLVMPAIMALIGFISFKIVREARATAPTVMVIGGNDSPAVRAALAANDKVKIVPAAADWKQQISDKKVRAAVELPAGFDAALAQGAAAAVKIYNYEGEMRSAFAVTELRRFFNDYRDKEIAGRLERLDRGHPNRAQSAESAFRIRWSCVADLLQ